MPKKLTDWDRKCQTAHGVTVKVDRKKTDRYKRRIVKVLKAHPKATYDLLRFIKEFRIRENSPRGGLIEFFNALEDLEVENKVEQYSHPKYQGIKAYRFNKEETKPI